MGDKDIMERARTTSDIKRARRADVSTTFQETTNKKMQKRAVWLSDGDAR
jgi:hypothetical protein